MSWIEVKNKHGKNVMVNLNQVLCVTESPEGTLLESDDRVAIVTEESYEEVKAKMLRAEMRVEVVA